MQYFVYIIFSANLNKYYVGYTEDIELRLTQHNKGFSTYTSKANDWKLKHTEIFNTRAEAMQREKYIKAQKSRKFIEALIKP
jgi:putative endonuclease